MSSWRALESENDIANIASPTAESVLALVSPFEGGRHYVLDAVKQVAADIDAEVLRFDLALGIGLHGDHSPLGQLGE
jgi:hypothetical protein